MASLVQSFKKQLKAAKKEYAVKRKDLERALAQLDRDYSFLVNLSAVRAASNGRRRATRAYGGVKTAVLDAIKASKGLKPAQIVDKTNLASAQVHNSLTGLKKAKLVRAKNGLYTA